MAYKCISNISIKAMTAALPSKEIGRTFFAERYGDKEVARVIRGTGIGSIRSGCDTSTNDLITAAGENLLQHQAIKKEAIDGLVVVTQTPDDWSPGAAFVVHQQLGLPTHCVVINLNDGCAGYGNGLIQAAALVASGACKNVLLCTGDINTRLIDDDDYQVRMLFGDASSATLITSGNETLSFIAAADGSGKGSLGVKLNYEKKHGETGVVQSLKMDGAAVMNFALRRVPEVINALLNAKGLTTTEIDLFALHQPNEFILNYIRDLLDVDPEQLPADVNGIGNTNSTSIPLLLSRQDWSLRPKRKNVVLSGFGVGLAWNALHVDLSNTAFIAPCEVEAVNIEQVQSV